MLMNFYTLEFGPREWLVKKLANLFCEKNRKLREKKNKDWIKKDRIN